MRRLGYGFHGPHLSRGGPCKASPSPCPHPDREGGCWETTGPALLAVLLLVAGSAAAEGKAPGSPTPGWPVKPNADAKRVFYENYEDGTCGRIKEGSSAAVVAADDGADVIAGKYCLRGNLDPKTTDPITRKKGKTKNAGLGWISFSDAGVRDELYVSFLWRLDRDNGFAPEHGGRGGAPSYKMVYVVGSAAPWVEKVNYTLIQTGNASLWRLGNNSPNGAKALAYGVGGQVGPEAAGQGAWHRVEFFLKLESTPGAADGVAVVKVDGEVCIDRRDVPYLWKGGKEQTWGMMSLPCMFGGAQGPKTSFGWQIDELEVWDGLPAPRQDGRPVQR